MLGGCATTAPPELIQARTAYTDSNNGLAAKLTPTELHDAWIVLAKANKEFDEHGDTTMCRDYAYIAQRKLELADVKARTELDRQKIAEAVKAGVVVRDTQVKNTRAALTSTREQLKEERATATHKTEEIEKTAEQLEAEKQAREHGRSQAGGRDEGSGRRLPPSRKRPVGWSSPSPAAFSSLRTSTPCSTRR